MTFSVTNPSNAHAVELYVKSRQSGKVTLGWKFFDSSSQEIVGPVTNIVDGWISMDTNADNNHPLTFPFTDSTLRSMTFSTDDGLIYDNEYHAVVTIVMDNGFSLESGTHTTSSHNTENELLFTLYELNAPQVTAAPADKRIVLSFDDQLVGLGNMSRNAPGNKVTHIRVTLKSNNPRNIQTYNIPVSELTAPATTLSTPPANQTGLQLVIGSTGQGIDLVNDKSYDLVVGYVTKAFDEFDNEVVANTLGNSPTTTILNVTPTTLSGAPRFVSIERPFTAETKNDTSMQIWFQAPDNDVNPDLNSTETAMTKYEVYRYKSASNPGVPSIDDNGDVTDTTNWVLVTGADGIDAKTDYYKDGGAITQATQMTAVYTFVDTELDDGGLYWYTVRGYRASTDLDTNITTEVRGLFSAPVSALVFKYLAVNAPAVTVSTVAGTNGIKQTLSYPVDGTVVGSDPVENVTASTVFDTAVADGLPSYSAKWVSNVAGRTEQSVNAGLATNSGDYTYTGLTFGTTYTFNSCLYRQTYNKVNFDSTNVNGEFLSVQVGGRTYESLNASAQNLISGLNSPAASSKSLTPFTVPGIVSNVASTGLQSDNTPWSTANDGKLRVTFTALASYDTSSRFYAALRYRVAGTPTNFADLSGLTTAPTGSNGIEGLTNGTGTTVTGLTLGTSYSLKIQAYFYNDENGVWEFGTETAPVTTGNTPFYYPSAITGLTLDASGNGYGYANWTTANSNGVNESDEVSLSYTIDVYQNASLSSSIHQSPASVTYNFLISKGNGYYVWVTSEYRVGSTDTYKSSGMSGVQVYLAVPADPSISLTPDNSALVATLTSGSNFSSIVFDHWEAQLDSNAKSTVTSPHTYTGLTNGQQYIVAVRGAYKYPSTEPRLFFSDWVSTSNSDLNGVPFGKPIINSATIANNLVTINVNNNGRSLREVLIVALPVDGQSANNIEIVYRNNSDSNPALTQVGDNNAVSRDISFSLTGGVQLLQALLVLENPAGATVALRST